MRSWAGRSSVSRRGGLTSRSGIPPTSLVDAEDQVFDAGDPCPLGPPEPAAVIVRYDLDALYEDIQAAFDQAGTPYQAEDILASIADLVSVAAELAAGGVRVKWFPIFPLQAALDAISVVQVAHPHLTIGTVRSHLYDGSYAFDGSTSFDGGYSALRVEHEEALAADHRIVTAPEHRFEGLARFDGLSLRRLERLPYDPRLHIHARGTAIAAAQAASQTVLSAPRCPGSPANSSSMGRRLMVTRRCGRSRAPSSIEHEQPAGLRAGSICSTPLEARFDGRGLVVHDVTITEVTA